MATLGGPNAGIGAAEVVQMLNGLADVQHFAHVMADIPADNTPPPQGMDGAPADLLELSAASFTRVLSPEPSTMPARPLIDEAEMLSDGVRMQLKRGEQVLVDLSPCKLSAGLHNFKAHGQVIKYCDGLSLRELGRLANDIYERIPAAQRPAWLKKLIDIDSFPIDKFLDKKGSGSGFLSIRFTTPLAYTMVASGQTIDDRKMSIEIPYQAALVAYAFSTLEGMLHRRQKPVLGRRDVICCTGKGDDNIVLESNGLTPEPGQHKVGTMWCIGIGLPKET